MYFWGVLLLHFICLILCINFNLFYGEISCAATSSLWNLPTYSFFLPSIRLSNLSVCCLYRLFLCVSVSCLSGCVCQFDCLSLFICVCQFHSVCLSASDFVVLCMCLSVCLSVCLSICLSVYLSVWHSVYVCLPVCLNIVTVIG